MDFSQLNVWPVVSSAVAAFVVGGVWYSPGLFGRIWQREAGLTAAQLASGNPAVTFGLSLVLALVASFAFAVFLGPKPALGFALLAGLSAGLAWVATSFGINYLFERKSVTLFLVNAGYHVVQYTLMGAILGLWH